MVSIVCVGLPASYTFGLTWGMGLPGLWIGYGLSNIVLTILYLGILLTLNWTEAAERAAEDELENGEQISSESTSEKDKDE
jgi:Na+-driven multidrug efflux pump